MKEISYCFRTSGFPAVWLSVQLGSRVSGAEDLGSVPAVHTPASTGDRGCRKPQDGSGLLRVKPGWSDSKTKGSVFCTSPTSNIQSWVKSGGPPVIFWIWRGFEHSFVHTYITMLFCVLPYLLRIIPPRNILHFRWRNRFRKNWGIESNDVNFKSRTRLRRWKYAC